MIKKSIDAIELADIEALIDGGGSPGLALAYLTGLPSEAEESRVDFLATIASFANSSGGDLVCGARVEQKGEDEETGGAKVVGLDIGDPEETRRRLESWVQDGISPQVAGLRYRFIRISDGRWVLLIRVPGGSGSLHEVKAGPKPVLFARSDAGRFTVSYQKVTEEESAGGKLLARFWGLRRARLRKLGPLLEGDAFVALHVLPLSALQKGESVDLRALLDEYGSFAPVGGHTGGFSARFNFDGVLVHTLSEGAWASHVQVFRNGAVEFASSEPFYENEKSRYLDARLLDRMILVNLGRIVALLQRQCIPSPLWIGISLRGAEGVMLDPGRHVGFRSDLARWSLDRYRVDAPFSVFLGDRQRLEHVVKPALDSLWQAGNLPGSESYDGKGNLRDRDRFLRY